MDPDIVEQVWTQTLLELQSKYLESVISSSASPQLVQNTQMRRAVRDGVPCRAMPGCHAGCAVSG